MKLKNLLRENNLTLSKTVIQNLFDPIKYMFAEEYKQCYLSGLNSYLKEDFKFWFVNYISEKDFEDCKINKLLQLTIRFNKIGNFS